MKTEDMLSDKIEEIIEERLKTFFELKPIEQEKGLYLLLREFCYNRFKSSSVLLIREDLQAALDQRKKEKK